MSNDPTVIMHPPKDKDSTGYDTSEANSGTHTVIQDADTNNQSIPNTVLRKLVGFLVSYSKVETGEYWPLYLGRNEIGSSRDSNSVNLREQKVSGNHAIINIRRVKVSKSNENKLVYVINDSSSTNGTIVNGDDLVFENGQRILSQSDMVDIGNYRLMLICVDTIALELTTNPEFVSLDNDAADDVLDYDQRESNTTRVYQ